MKNSFFYVDEKYIEFLKNREISERGFTTVPNVKYANSRKFVYGAVLEIDGISFFVPVTSYTKKKEDNILVYVSDHKRMTAVASLRFNYMIPVPDNCLKAVVLKNGNFDERERIFIEKEYRFCVKRASAIKKQATKTYYRVTNKVSDELVKNSCDFQLLEKAYIEWRLTKAEQ